MKVEEAKKYIEGIDRNRKNLQKLCTLSKEEREALAEKVGIDSFDGMLNMAINCMIVYKNVLKRRIDNSELSK